MNNEDRKVRLTNLQFVEQRILNVNTSFASCLSFLYACLAHIENQQLTSRINMSVMRGSKRKKADGGYEYGLQDAFQVFDTISNSIRLVYNNTILTLRKISYIILVWAQVNALTKTLSFQKILTNNCHLLDTLLYFSINYSFSNQLFLDTGQRRSWNCSQKLKTWVPSIFFGHSPVLTTDSWRILLLPCKMKI